MPKLHKSSSGKWVPCPANIKCRISGEADHTTKVDLSAAAFYASKVTGKQVDATTLPMESLTAFKQLPEITRHQLKQIAGQRFNEDAQIDEQIERQDFIRQQQENIAIEKVESKFSENDSTASDVVSHRLHQTSKYIAEVVDRISDPDMAEYYAATDKKHFSDKDAPGSKFLDPKLKTIEDVLVKASLDRGKLSGDDRDGFIALGANPAWLNPNNRYLMVKTPGTVGVKNTKTMKSTDYVRVERTKPGVPCSFVAYVEEQPKTDYGVIVMSHNKETGKEMVVTTFPGMPTKAPKSDEIDSHEGQWVTVAEARKLAGGDFFAQTALVTNETRASVVGKII